MSTRVIIIGSGPAGYTAAIYAARALCNPVLICGPQPGGQLTVTTDVENYPGFPDIVQGPWLMEQMQKQAEHCGATIVTDHVETADLSERPFRVITSSGKRYETEALIIATGAQARWLGLPSEERFRGFGVSACATCDGIFFIRKHVVVVGGGNTAAEEALFLSKYASKVTLVHRGASLRAEKILQQRLFNDTKIEVVWEHVVDEVLGNEEPALSVEGIRLRHARTVAVQNLPADGLFVAIGHSPSVRVFGDQLRQKPGGYIWVEPGSTRTSVPGVFAAGDVSDDVYRQAVTAAGLGCMAAIEAERFLAHPHS
ncbi:thioredoxin-disulfide reductase [Mesorhizobium sp. XAP10]|uniref:thioredoxin-disulfide reductase n=1 Tax=unclassified Mesorhizobium TaxID=325217 RepID=UPI0023DEE86B|nr:MULTISPECIES: thioredoxin-disulfide reductase [unclassified Mesorhizobium]MDF3156074.1 thioredoxin-disulfide reductase [Mesorhizobium sp. XAP10]MDF3248911.1 thioredoxin-disulfide reductase [Mesorhizobium sp. XAP4]